MPRNKTSLVANELKAISKATGVHMKIYRSKIKLIKKLFLEKIVFEDHVYRAIVFSMILLKLNPSHVTNRKKTIIQI